MAMIRSFMLKKEGIPEYMVSISGCLRRNHGLKRLPAEWLCYRLSRLVLVKHHEGYAPFTVAAQMFVHWKILHLDEEFNSLFVALVINEEPKENLSCLVTIDPSSGTPSAPDGTEVR